MSRMGHYLKLLIQHTCPEPKFLYLILLLGGAYAIMGRESHDSTLLHKRTGSHVAYGTQTHDHVHFEMKNVL